MNTALEIGTACAEPGARAEGLIPLGATATGVADGIPVIVVNGAGEGPVLWINGAIHGDEPEGPLSVLLLLRTLDPARLRGAVVAVPAINVPAFSAGTRGNALDTHTYDMNRIYPGSAQGFPTERVAFAHHQAMIGVADLEISVHSGGDHSYLARAIFVPDNAPSLELAQAMGPAWDLLLRGGPGGRSPSNAMAAAGKGGITVELGGLCAMLPEQFRESGQMLTDAYLNVLRHYGMIDGTAEYASAWMVGEQRLVLAGSDGLWMAEPGFRFREPVAAGTVLARIYDLYGHEVEQVEAPCDGQVFGMRTRPPVHRGDWAVFFGKINERQEGPLRQGSRELHP